MDTHSPSGPAFLCFDRVADQYDATRFLPPAVADAAARRVLAGLAPTEWFLDAGVGTGRFGRALARRHTRTVGVDVSWEMMRRLRERSRGAPCPYLAGADLRALPFADAAFAGAMAVHVLHLIADWRQALSEIWRVLRPGAALVVAVEDGSRTHVRDFYLDRAQERGVLPPTLGARTTDVLAEMDRRGGRPTEIRATDLRWERIWSAREVLSMLERRTYSLLWDIPEEIHASLLAQTREWTLRSFGTLDARERVEAQLVLYAARKP